MSIKSMTIVNFLPDPVQYRPGKGRDKETTKRMRAHVAEHLRKQRHHQLNLNPSIRQNKPLQTVRDRTFCICIVEPISKGSEKTTKISQKSRKQQAIEDSHKICPRCGKPQFTELSRLGQLEIARQKLPSVTPFLEVDYNPYQDLPELVSFKHSVSTRHEMDEFKARVIVKFSYNDLRLHILPVAAQTPALFWGVLYSVCTTLNGYKGRPEETQLTMAIKHEAIRQINTHLAKGVGTSITIAAIAYLTAGIIVHGGPGVAQELQAHERGIMLLMSKVKWKFDETDRFGHVLFAVLTLHNMTRRATACLPIEPQFIELSCQPTKTFIESDYLLESPFYCPRADFFTVRDHPKCSAFTLRILRNVRKLVDYALGDDILLDYESARHEILTMPSATSSLDPQIHNDDIYESVRLTSIILIQALDTQTPFAELPNTADLISQLQRAMQKTSIGNYWGSMSGVLLWITMTGYATAMGKQGHGYMCSVMMTGNHELTYNNPYREVATIAAWRFQKLHMGLKNAWEERNAAIEGLFVE